MSSRARLLLLSGTGGSGTSTIASATVAAIEAEGMVVVRIDATARQEPAPVVVDHLIATAGRLMPEAGGDPLLGEAWVSLVGIDHLSALVRILSALGEPAADAVVVDCGDYRRARDLVDLPAVVIRLLDAALTPRLAMRRSTVAAESSGLPTLFEALSSARADLVRMRQALTHPATMMRLVTIADDVAVERTADALAVFSVLGIAVDGIVVNRFPRSSDGWPADTCARAERALASMHVGADGVSVWKSTTKLRPAPKGRSPLGPLGHVRVLDADQLTVHIDDEELGLELPLAGPARRRAEVGVQDTSLVIRFDDCLRWIDLPPVLRRCLPTHATRTSTGLRVAFVPDPATWRQPAAS